MSGLPDSVARRGRSPDHVVCRNTDAIGTAKAEHGKAYISAHDDRPALSVIHDRGSRTHIPPDALAGLRSLFHPKSLRARGSRSAYRGGYNAGRIELLMIAVGFQGECGKPHAVLEGAQGVHLYRIRVTREEEADIDIHPAKLPTPS